MKHRNSMEGKYEWLKDMMGTERIITSLFRSEKKKTEKKKEK